MQRYAWKLWAAAGLSAGLLELPFPLAGPLPPWRSIFAWFGMAPLLWAILSPDNVRAPRPVRRAFLLAYLCGILWYMGNCYWVRDTMSRYGEMPLFAPTLLLIGFSLVLGLYFGIFGLLVMMVRRATGSAKLALIAAPIFWAALELAASRITSVPWDQLGYSQVDNGLVNPLAPWAGVYGITFLIVAMNALIAENWLVELSPTKWFARRQAWGLFLGILIIFFGSRVWVLPRNLPPSATAVLVQPNLDVAADNLWQAQDWSDHIAQFNHLAAEQCKTYIAGIPQTGAPSGEVVCPPYPTHPDLVVWPEAPAPFVETDPRFQQALASIALSAQAPLIVGNVGADFSTDVLAWHDYNSALIIAPDGTRIGRYDKIHLVPFGEYIPFKNLLFFAHKLTGRVSEFTRGTDRKVFLIRGSDGSQHRYAVFICYEAVFGDEVREFSRNGAEVLVNISDDGWYGDTSAPWQHLNMARMRAIENRRWILRDTNNGITAVIDPYGRVRQSIPRHQVDALPAQYGFRNDVTFYTAHGDVFAWCCAILALGIVAWATRFGTSLKVQIKVRS
jgi:apolipoprotein N-acyltransferase